MYDNAYAIWNFRDVVQAQHTIGTGWDLRPQTMLLIRNTTLLDLSY